MHENRHYNLKKETVLVLIHYCHFLQIKFILELGKKTGTKRQPPERFELSTPGLQDQCSNHWAKEAVVAWRKILYKLFNNDFIWTNYSCFFIQDYMN